MPTKTHTTEPAQTRAPRNRNSGALTAADVLAVQRTAGNRAAQQLIAQQRVQAKLTVGPVDDLYEREADRMADAVMSSPVLGRTGVGDASLQRETQPEEDELQTKPLAAQITSLTQREAMPEEEEEVQRQAREEDELQTKAVQRSSDGSFEAGADVEQRITQSKGAGSPLPDATRAEMEGKFGADFSGVRVHAGSDAAQLNRDLSAQAFTHGSDVYFGEGKFAPTNDEGKHLLAHELTHVVQQEGAHAGSMLRKPKPRPQQKKWQPQIANPELVDRLIAPNSPLWRQLNPDQNAVVNCPATAASVDEFLTSGHIKPAPAGDAASNFRFEIGPWSQPMKSFSQIRKLLTLPNTFLVVQASRSKSYADEHNTTTDHWFVIVNHRGRVQGLDAYRSGQVIDKIDAFITKQGFIEFRYYQGAFRVIHEPLNLDLDTPLPDGKAQRQVKNGEVLQAKSLLNYGSDVCFGEGKFASASGDGKHSLAHELMHVLQQGTSVNTQAKLQNKFLSANGKGNMVARAPKSSIHGHGLGPSVTTLIKQLPNPEEEMRIRQEFRKSLDEPRWQARMGELKSRVSQSASAVYYIVKYKINFVAHQTPHPFASPTYTVTNVDVLDIDISTTKINQRGDMDPPEKPSGLVLHGVGAEYSWKAQKKCITSIVPTK